MRKLLYIFTGAVLLIGLLSCDKKDEPVAPEGFKKTVLVYAVASNNLYNNLVYNKKAMLVGMQDVDLDHNNLLLYEVNNRGETTDVATLYKVTKDSEGILNFTSVKTYDRNTYSTDPARIREVIDETMSIAPAEKYDIFFWSHGTGWSPSENRQHDNNNGAYYSFGYDTYHTITDEIDIDELAACLPNNKFETVWFDACYMSNIETIYEFRGKCKYFVGYPTEIYSQGLPYDKVLPLLYKQTPDIAGAAKAVYDFYSADNAAVTVCAVDMSQVDYIADVVREINHHITVIPENFTSVLNYARRPYGPFYDLGQYYRVLSSANGLSQQYIDAIDYCIDRIVIYRAASTRDFNNRPIPEENFSGISVHHFDDDGSEDAEFYKRLKWYASIWAEY